MRILLIPENGEARLNVLMKEVSKILEEQNKHGEIGAIQEDCIEAYGKLQEAQELMDIQAATDEEKKQKLAEEAEKQKQLEKEGKLETPAKARQEGTLSEQQRVINNLTAAFAKLEQINGDLRLAVGKMKKQLVKAEEDHKEASLESEQEIERLTDLLNTETENTKELTEEVSYWKESAMNLSTSLSQLQEQTDQIEETVTEVTSRQAEIDIDQRIAIVKMKKKLMRTGNFKEAFLVQDKEIERLSTELAIECEKSSKLSSELTHWKDSATNLSKSLCVLGDQQKEQQSKQSKRYVKMLAEVSELKQEKQLRKMEVSTFKDTIADLERRNNTLRANISLNGSIKLSGPLSGLNSSFRSGISGAPSFMDESHRTSSNALDESITDTDRNAGGFSDFDVSKRVKSQMAKSHMKYGKLCLDTGTVYQLTCRDCKPILNFMGITGDDLQTRVVQYCREVYQIVKHKYIDKNLKNGKKKSEYKFSENQSSAARHFAKHCKNAKTFEEVAKMCEKFIKVEQLSIVCTSCLGTATNNGWTLWFTKGVQNHVFSNVG